MQSATRKEEAIAIPGAAVYGQQQNQANLAYQNAMNNIRTKRLSAFERYGFQGNVDPNSGAVSGLRVDANNPTGLYQQMLRGQSGEMHHAQDMARARGLTGGYVQQGIGDLQNQEAVQSGNFAQTMQDEMTGLDQGIQQAGIDRSNAMTDIQHQALLDAISSGQFNPAPVVAPQPPTPGRKATPAKHRTRQELARRVAKARRARRR